MGASPAVIRLLADLISPKANGQQVGMLWAVVVATSAGPPKTITIQAHGSDVQIPGVRYVNGYTPTVNDVVYGRIVGTDFLVEGKLA